MHDNGQRLLGEVCGGGGWELNFGFRVLEYVTRLGRDGQQRKRIAAWDNRWKMRKKSERVEVCMSYILNIEDIIEVLRRLKGLNV